MKDAARRHDVQTSSYENQSNTNSQQYYEQNQHSHQPSFWQETKAAHLKVIELDKLKTLLKKAPQRNGEKLLKENEVKIN